MKHIVFDEKKCAGCNLCELFCSSKWYGAFNPKKSRIRITTEDYADPKYNVCLQCDDAPCVEACPTEALVIDPDLERVVLIEDKCIGCRLCVRACPYNGIYWHKDYKLPIKCNLCEGEPECVKICPKNALSVGD
ncbi:MAG TPA: 4Fe-4S dicluster domain-containing protein [Methanofastidiosum sp.]|jgi:Fe-S-cluster-containing hydrogenase component 2|nr:4Fe-4S dicluster domain-containing protein [Methanofastidiosum sp.]HNZ87536.1 4Fe-4S dicluster domain-containing protein [Methanofastidiosum sp.]HOC77304.1 4Fe-4S dicluster domain-containing protein [Methanofastidiosum sp.]HOG73933.1 4Fe-4S dicluster domain-containing protein [Methanofastidiosum sp.]HPA48710.1 4Fe-4S dicluster domain-containing protein [Methanofastidiosum sp.]